MCALKQEAPCWKSVKKETHVMRLAFTFMKELCDITAKNILVSNCHMPVDLKKRLLLLPGKLSCTSVVFVNGCKLLSDYYQTGQQAHVT